MKLTAQNIFDHVANHLLNQNAFSVAADTRCAYRGAMGRRCAIGCLIPDAEYDKRIEGEPVQYLLYGVVDGGPTIMRMAKFSHLLAELQTVHDHYPCAVWESRLRIVAHTCGLQFNTVRVPHE